MIAAIRLAKQLAKNQSESSSDVSRLILKSLSGLIPPCGLQRRLPDQLADFRADVSAFINDSPTKIAFAPHFTNRSTSARV